MYSFNDIKTIHLEITDKCNASCPQCSRNINGGKTNPLLPLVELSLSDLQKMLPLNFVKQLDRFYMCGNYGDPIIAKDTLKIFEWIMSINPNIEMTMFTNGSGRNLEWWQHLAKILNGKSYVRYGIDGLEDTNCLYRKGTQWQKIMQGIDSFMNAGGNAQWDFIVFRHNEHQIDEARKLAQSLGFSKFTVKKTNRFYSSKLMKPIHKFEVLDRNDNILYYLEPPNNIKYVNDKTINEDFLIEKYGSMNNYLDCANIECKVAAEKSIFISSEGLVFPCCWTGIQLYSTDDSIQSRQIKTLLDKYGGKSSINAKIQPLKQIVEGPVFTEIKHSWNQSSILQGKLKVCSRICGNENNSFKEMFSSNE